MRSAVDRLLAFLSFHYHLIAKKPYFGDYMASHQLSPPRAPFMRRLMQKICSERGSLLMLGIGSWAGESAILWAEVGKQTLAENHRQPPSIVCVDPWTSYLSLDGNPHLGSMRRAALSDRIFSLFLHNIKSSGHDDVIISLRTWSDVAARFFRTDLFDMVYIDGDHAYSSVVSDIRNYAPLVIDGRYICGDDLELRMGEVDRNFASAHRDKDLVRDASTGTDFHPGVTLAVGEFFGEVSAYAGFWVMQKAGGAGRKVAL